jgi:putative transcriptional regulator
MTETSQGTLRFDCSDIFYGRQKLPPSAGHDTLSSMHHSHSLKLPWLLVATPQLLDPNFKKKIVLIVEHGHHGSMGFVINQPIRTPLADLIVDSRMTIPRHLPAWYGGPVQGEHGIILHEGSSAPVKSTRTITSPGAQTNSSVSQGEYLLSSSEEALTNLILNLDARHRDLKLGVGEESTLSPGTRLYPFRFLVGYTGWRGGQLENEIRQGAWIQTPVSPQLVFDTPWPELWTTALALIGVNPRALAPGSPVFIN